MMMLSLYTHPCTPAPLHFLSPSPEFHAPPHTIHTFATVQTASGKRRGRRKCRRRTKRGGRKCRRRKRRRRTRRVGGRRRRRRVGAR
jgi:hypothetical protein